MNTFLAVVKLSADTRTLASGIANFLETHGSLSEKAISDEMTSWLQDLGFTVEVQVTDTTGTSLTPLNAQANALQVIALTPHIREYLSKYDPKALEQVQRAIPLNAPVTAPATLLAALQTIADAGEKGELAIADFMGIKAVARKAIKAIQRVAKNGERGVVTITIPAGAIDLAREMFIEKGYEIIVDDDVFATALLEITLQEMAHPQSEQEWFITQLDGLADYIDDNAGGDFVDRKIVAKK